MHYYYRARLIVWVTILGLWLYLGSVSMVKATSITSLNGPTTTSRQYDKFELTFQLDRTFPAGSFLPYYYYDPADNPNQNNYQGRRSPYGIDGITIDAVFTSPSGKKQTVPAFYYQSYSRSGPTLTPGTDYSWKVRFAPAEVGNYTYYLTVTDKSGSTRYPTSGSTSFSVSANTGAKGFVRVSPRDPRFMEFDNGQSFIPIATGQQWPGSGEDSAFYESAFTKFAAHGINIIRIWDQNDGYNLTVEGPFDAYKYPDDFNPEDSGVVDLKNNPRGTQMNQRGNFQEDIIVEAARQKGVYLQLCSHGDPYWIWDRSVYNESWAIERWNPNPVGFNDPNHLNYWKRNFRYRVARWGYSTSVLSWETWNEHGNISPDMNVYAFYQNYADFQRTTDPFDHLITTSQGSQNWSPSFWGSAAFDIANYHDYMMSSRYPDGVYNDEVNFVYRLAQCLRSSNPKAAGCTMGVGDSTSWQNNKPIIWAELDTGTTNWNESNPQPRSDHNTIWAGLFSPLGTVPIDWYDKSYIETKYDWAKIASDFFSNIDYAGERFSYLSTSDVRQNSEQIESSNNQLRVLAMRNAAKNRAYVWVHNKSYIWKNGTSETVSAQSGTIRVPSLNDGSYRITYHNTHNGTISDGGVQNSTQGMLVLSANNVVNDVAVKIISTNVTNPTPTPTLIPTPSPSVKQGDANGDGEVDGIDFSIWQRNYNHVVSGGPTKGDFDNSGEVDGIDFSIWQRNY